VIHLDFSGWKNRSRKIRTVDFSSNKKVEIDKRGKLNRNETAGRNEFGQKIFKFSMMIRYCKKNKNVSSISQFLVNRLKNTVEIIILDIIDYGFFTHYLVAQHSAIPENNRKQDHRIFAKMFEQPVFYDR